MPRYKLSVEYDGSGFKGWQKQDNLLTVQSVLEHAIYNFSHELVDVVCAGRTDAGVHAVAQVVHFDLTKNYPLNVVQNALNYHLKPNLVSVFDVQIVPEAFSARFSAKKRHYIYKILNRYYPLTFEKQLLWWVYHPLHVDKMQEAANLLIGTNDLSTFRSSGCQSKSPIKTINDIRFTQENDKIFMHISAPSFMYHQVRNIIGTLYLVGILKWEVQDFASAFNAKDRTCGGITAPAHGLYLSKIDY